MTDEWKKKLWGTEYNGMLLSHKKRNEFESVELRWMKLEPVRVK